MSRKIVQISPGRLLNCHIHPVLYRYYLIIHDTMGAEIVHRRTRSSDMAIEIIFYNDGIVRIPVGRLNSLPEAERCCFWIMCRPQTSPKRAYYHGKQVFQLFLTPVHPKKRREIGYSVTPLYAPVSAARSHQA
jgi:hypothetical protein